jgi:hypothetical protein
MKSLMSQEQIAQATTFNATTLAKLVNACGYSGTFFRTAVFIGLEPVHCSFVYKTTWRNDEDTMEEGRIYVRGYVRQDGIVELTADF